ncbi:MAG: hypothetical protein JST93_00815 [Acidobacteria bacterium]|nr:hypothetical protein [Acidobacteriota bacterium]
MVFGTGFVLGPMRILLLVPRVGERWAELAEMPVMLTACYLSARWVCRRFAMPARASPRILMGLLAMVLLLAAEFGLVLSLRGMSVAEYLATRDPVSGAAYYLAVAAFGALPWWLGRRA